MLLKKINFLLSFLCVSTLISCSSYRVDNDYDSDFDFSKLKTYAYEEKGSPTTNVGESSLIGRRIKSSIDREMNDKALEKNTDKDSADILIAIEYRNREYLRSNPRTSVGVGGRVGGGMGVGVGYGVPSSYYGKKDLISLRFLLNDAQKTEIWKGVVSGDIEKDDPHQTTSSINDAVEKLLDKFPPNS